MKWHTETPPHDITILAKGFNPFTELGYNILILSWSENEVWNDKTETYDDCWVGVNEFIFYDNEIFAWISLDELVEDFQIDVEKLIKERNL